MDDDRADTPSILVMTGSVSPGDVELTVERLAGEAELCDPGIVTCDVGGVIEVDLSTVDVLARLHLRLLRTGRGLSVRNASYALRGLLLLTGLSEVLRTERRLAVETHRQIEEREEARGVQKEGDAADRAV